MKLINRIAGAVLGTILGIFIAPCIPWIVDGKGFLLKILNDFRSAHKLTMKQFSQVKTSWVERRALAGSIGALLLNLLIINPFFLVVILIASAGCLIKLVGMSLLGFLLICRHGPYIGYKGGVISSKDQKAPVMDFFHVLLVIFYAYDAGLLNNIKNYLACNYIGFSEILGITPDYNKLLFLDLRNDPKFAPLIKNYLKATQFDNEFLKKTYNYFKFMEIKRPETLEYLAFDAVPEIKEQFPKTYISTKLLLMSLLENQIIQPCDYKGIKVIENLYGEMLEKLVKKDVLKPRRGKMDTPLQRFCNSPLFHRELVTEHVLDFLRPKPVKTETEETETTRSFTR